MILLSAQNLSKTYLEGTVRICPVGRSRRLCAQFDKERVVIKMKKSDEELFLLKDQRSTNEEDGKQQQNLLGLLRTHVVEHLDMTRELTDDELYASIDEVLMMPQYRKQFSVRILMQLRQAWLSLTDVCEIEEVKEYAKAFVLAKRSGASMPFILQKIASQIVLKVQTQSQIETMLAGKKLEKRL